LEKPEKPEISFSLKISEILSVFKEICGILLLNLNSIFFLKTLFIFLDNIKRQFDYQ